MWSRLFLHRLCLLSTLTVSPLAANSDIQLQMRHEIDRQCDGTPDANAKAIPGSCIIYSVIAINTSDIPYQNVSISAHIPEHTTLIREYQYSHNQQTLPSTTLRGSNGAHLIKTQLSALQPGEENKISVSYSVKIR